MAAPTERSDGALEVLRPARHLIVCEDVPAANTALVARAHAAAPALQFYPEAMPPRRAVAVLQKEVRSWAGGDAAGLVGARAMQIGGRLPHPV